MLRSIFVIFLTFIFYELTTVPFNKYDMNILPNSQEENIKLLNKSSEDCKNGKINIPFLQNKAMLDKNKDNDILNRYIILSSQTIKEKEFNTDTIILTVADKETLVEYMITKTIIPATIGSPNGVSVTVTPILDDNGNNKLYKNQ